MDKLLKHCTIQTRRIDTYCILENKGCYRKEIKNRKAYQTIDSSKDIFQAVFARSNTKLSANWLVEY